LLFLPVVHYNSINEITQDLRCKLSKIGVSLCKGQKPIYIYLVLLFFLYDFFQSADVQAQRRLILVALRCKLLKTFFR